MVSEYVAHRLALAEQMGATDVIDAGSVGDLSVPGIQSDRKPVIAGEVTGRSNQQAVYVLDLRNQRIAALLYDSRSKRLEPVAGRNISGDLAPNTRR